MYMYLYIDKIHTYTAEVKRLILPAYSVLLNSYHLLVNMLDTWMQNKICKLFKVTDILALNGIKNTHTHTQKGQILRVKMFCYASIIFFAQACFRLLPPV